MFLWIGLIGRCGCTLRFPVMTPVAMGSVHEEVHQRTGKKHNVGKEGWYVHPMLDEQY